MAWTACLTTEQAWTHPSHSFLKPSQVVALVSLNVITEGLSSSGVFQLGQGDSGARQGANQVGQQVASGPQATVGVFKLGCQAR